MTASTPALDADVRPSLDALLESLSPVDLGQEMADGLAVEVPALAEANDPDLYAGLVLSCKGNLFKIWELISDPSLDIRPVTPPVGAAAFARELAHRGLPLSVLLRAYRLGHGYVEQRLADAAADFDMPAQVRWQILTFFTRATFEYIDEVCTQLVDDYEQERARWVRGAAAARAECVQAIIERRPIKAAEATERLGYDVGRRHLAFIVWAESPDENLRSGGLERAALQLASALGGGPTLTVPVGERVVWAWTSGDAVTDDPAAIQARVAPGLRAAVGTPASGPVGMADSHEDAFAVRRISHYLVNRPGAVVGYRSCSLLTLLTADAARALRFVKTELGDLSNDDDASLRLRATLRVYLDEGLSPARTGRRLSIHLNTVVYRVKQAESILGRPVDERRLELEAALRLADRLPALEESSLRALRQVAAQP